MPQMELYHEIGWLVCERTEKGAAVAAAEYLQSTYPVLAGFSPCNLHNKHVFYETYESALDLMSEVFFVGWTQNVVIVENRQPKHRAWYLAAARLFGWSKVNCLPVVRT